MGSSAVGSKWGLSRTQEALRATLIALILLALASASTFAGPAISISPGSVSFGDQAVGTTSADQAVTVTNTGDAPLSVFSVFNQGGNTGEFNGTQSCTDAPLPPNGSCAIFVRFTPGGAGARSTTLTIVSNAPGSPHTVSLSGTGTLPATPAISISPGSLDFGQETVGTTSGEQTITVTNTGTAPLTVTGASSTGANPDEFLVTQNCTQAPLAPGASCSISVRFAPKANGPRSGSVAITSNAPGGARSVALSGAGASSTAPAVSLSAASLSFGTQTVGTTSAAQSVTVTNTGTAPLALGGISLGGAQAASFSLVGGGESSAVAPGASRSISATFSPTSVGNKSATLVISSNAPGSPHTVALSGAGAATTAPGFRVSPSNLTFAKLEVGESSSPKSVTVTNTGTAPLTISSVTLSGDPDFIVTGGAGTLSPGASQTLSVTFTPTAAGGRSATLSISHNAPGSPHTVALQGTGADPPPPPRGSPAAVVTPTALDFGSVPVGVASPPMSVRVASTGTAPLVIRSLTLTGAGKADFELVDGDSGTIAEGMSQAISLRVTPSRLGSRTATLEIRTNASKSLQRVALSGTGVATPPPGDWPVLMHDARQLGLAEAGLDPHTLSPWSAPLGSRVTTSPVVRGGVAYVGTEAGSLVAIDTTTRTQRWSRALPAPIRSAPAAAADEIIVAAGALSGLRPTDGTTLWQRSDIIPTDGAAPMLVNDTVYISAHAPGETRSTLHAVKAATGANAWSTPAPLPAGLQGRGAVAAYPEIGLLFVSLGPPPDAARPSAGPGVVLALRLADGGAAWAAPAMVAAAPPAGLSVGWVASTPALPVPQPTVFITSGSRVTALNAATGAPFWWRDLPETALQGPPLLSTAAPEGSTLYVGGASGRVYALASTTGADASGSMTALAQPITGTMALAGGYLYVPTGSGLVAAEAKSGVVLWTLPGAMTTGVAVAGGCPFVGTADGRLLGFAR